jgi:hypothetical protein
MIGIILFLFLGFIMHATRGLSQPGGVLFLIGAMGVLLTTLLRGGALAWGKPSERSSRLALALGFAASAALLFFEPLIVYARVLGWMPLFSLSVGAALLGAFIALAHEIAPQAGLGRASLTALVVAGAALIAARALVVLIAPAAAIDVWVFNMMACEHLLDGKNPYSFLYPDIYHGKWPYSPYNCYPPGYLLSALPFKVGLGDVRWLHVFADLVSAASLYLIGRKNALSERTSLLIAVTWLAAPVSIYIIDQALVDPVVSAWSGVFFLAMTCRRWLLAAVLLGILCTIKQYAFVIGLGALPWLLSQVPRRQWLACAGAMFGTAAVIVLPFALTDWPGFSTSVIQTVARFSLRLDAFNLSSLVANELDLRLPSFVSSLLTLLALAGGLVWLWKRPSRQLSDAAGYVVLCFGVIFLFGPQASCNYYHLLAYFILLALVLNGGASEGARDDRDRVGMREAEELSL